MAAGFWEFSVRMCGMDKALKRITLLAVVIVGVGAWSSVSFLQGFSHLGATSTLQQEESVTFSRYFVDKTMRVDYFHGGGLGNELLGLDQVVSDGPWAGSRTRLIDDLNLGKYLFEVVDDETGRLIFSRGFASIYGEWETTAE